MVRILVVDDDEDFRLLVQTILEDEGHEVVTARDGIQGMTLQRQSPADLLITDMIMPEKDGIETIRDFRQEFPGIRIVAVTGGGRLQNPAHLFAATELGASVILRKPVDMDALVGVVRGILAEGRIGA